MTHCTARRYAGSLMGVLLISLTACSESVVPPAPPTTLGQAIVNGSADPLVVDLSDGEMLAIGWLHLANSVGANFCTGTLIAPRVVVTAEHCTVDYQPSDIGFAVGSAPQSARASFDVAEIHEHWWSDIALLVLDEDATVVVPQLTVIAANTDPLYNADIGTPLDASGYGDTYGTNPDGRWFARVYLDDVDSTTIVVDGRGEQGICYGDSGGPVLWEQADGEVVVVAVESYGDDSCVDRDTMTRVDALFTEFIEPILNAQPAHDPCQGVDYAGRCDGDMVEWCEDGALQRRDCGSVDTTCGWVGDDIGYDCTCGSLDYLGRCDGNIVEWCDGGRYQAVDCAGNSTFCGWVDQDTGYFCVDTPPNDQGSTVPTTDDEPATDPNPDPVVDTPVTDTPVDPEPSASDDEPYDAGPRGPQAIGCTQANRSSTPNAPLNLFALALFGLMIVRRQRQP